MQVSVEINDLECRMTVGVPRARVDEEIQTRLKDLARKSRINGFRPGKVPVRVIQQRYGEQVREEVLGELTNESLQNAVSQENLRPAGMPTIEFGKDDNSDEHISFTATFEIYPQNIGISLEGLSIEKPVAEVAEENIDDMINKLRKQRQSFVTVERAAAKGDQVIVNFEGFLEDQSESFAGSSATNYQLELGSGRLIEGFEEGLIGISANEQRDLHLHFPDNYKSQELAGKPVTFKVTAKVVQEARLPELDESFIKSLGIEEGSLEAFRTDIRENLQRELSKTLKNNLKQQVLEKLLENNPIKPPRSLIESDALQLKESAQKELVNQGVNIEEIDLSAERFIDHAEQRVKLGLLVAEVIKQNNLHAKAEKIREMVEDIASTYEDPEVVVAWFYSDPEHLKEIEASVLENEVVDWVLGNVAVTEKLYSFAEIMKLAPVDAETENNAEQ